MRDGNGVDYASALQVEVHLHGGLVRFVPEAPRGVITRELPQGARVVDLLASFDFPEGDVIVGLDGQTAKPDDPVRDGARIDLVAPITGGDFDTQRRDLGD